MAEARNLPLIGEVDDAGSLSSPFDSVTGHHGAGCFTREVEEGANHVGAAWRFLSNDGIADAAQVADRRFGCNLDDAGIVEHLAADDLIGGDGRRGRWSAGTTGEQRSANEGEQRERD